MLATYLREVVCPVC